MPTALCSLSDLDQTQAKGMVANINGEPVSLFVVKNDQGVFAYVNVCPHAGAPLEWREDDFLNDEREYIVCGMHGALFQIEDGLCIDGPCYDDQLTAVPVRVENGSVYLLADS